MNVTTNLLVSFYSAVAPYYDKAAFLHHNVYQLSNFYNYLTVACKSFSFDGTESVSPK
jgi:hypothetical protein